MSGTNRMKWEVETTPLYKQHSLYDDKTLAGRIGYQPMTDRLVNLYVDPAYRGKGLAHKLIERILERDDPSNLVARSTGDMTQDQLIELYEKHGFVQSSEQFNTDRGFVDQGKIHMTRKTNAKDGDHVMAAINGEDFGLNGLTPKESKSFDEAIKQLWDDIKPKASEASARQTGGPSQTRVLGAGPNTFRRSVASKFGQSFHGVRGTHVSVASESRLYVPQYDGIPMRRDDPANQDGKLLNMVQRMTREIKRLRKLAFHHGQLADNDLGDTISKIKAGFAAPGNHMLNERDIREIRSLYDGKWFLNLPYTLEGKQKIAACLLEEYGKRARGSTPALWRNIVNNDETTLFAISSERFMSVNDEAYQQEHHADK